MCIRDRHYFATAWVPPQGKPRNNEVLEVQKNLYAARTIEAVGEIAPGAAARVDSHLWVGPQDQKAMAALAPGLEPVSYTHLFPCSTATAAA